MEAALVRNRGLFRGAFRKNSVQFERLKAIQFAKKHLMLAGKFTIATEYCTQALRAMQCLPIKRQPGWIATQGRANNK